MMKMTDTMNARPDDPIISAKEVTARFRVLGELGEGGTAHVYLAVSRGPAGFNKLLVLKQPREQFLKSSEWLAMFLDEARLAARLNHPNIVQTYEVTEDRGLPCIVMEYLEGQPLSRIIKKCEGKLTLAMQLRILGDVLAGLHYAHELTDYDGTSLQLVHRDVSPQNVFVTFDGQVKVLDFGIAKITRSSTHTEVGVIKGKVHYMPPEQIGGDGVDRRSDLFAVGVMLWEAVAGCRMWQDMPVTKIFAGVLNGNIPTLRSVRPDAPEELDRICAKALAVDKEDRYATAADFEADLEAAAEKLGLRGSNREIGKMLSSVLSQARAQTRAIIDEHVGKVASLSWDEYRNFQSVSPLRLTGTALTQSGSLDNMQVETSVATGTQSKTVAVPTSYAWLGLGALALVTILIVGLARRDEPKPKPQEVVTAASSSVPIVETASAAPAVVAEKLIRLHFAASPSAAKLYWDGALLQNNPYDNQMWTDNKVHTLRAVAPGYESNQTTVLLDRDAEVVLTLQRSKTTAVPKPRTGKPGKPGEGQFVDDM